MWVNVGSWSDEDRVMVAGRQGPFKESAGTKHSRVQMAHGWRICRSMGDALDEVLNILGLFAYAHVFHCVDELGISDLGRRHRGEQEDLQLGP